MTLCALCEQPATAVQILTGGRVRLVCVLHDVPSSVAKLSAENKSAGPDEPPALAAE